MADLRGEMNSDPKSPEVGGDADTRADIASNEDARGNKGANVRKGGLVSAAKERGVALIMVIACLAIIFPFVTEFGYRARVDWQAAVNQGDEVRVRNIERGVMRLSTLMFELQRMVFNQRMVRQNFGVFDVTQFAPYLMSIFGSQDGAEGLGAMAGLNTSALPSLSLGEGFDFEVRVEAEGGRINVNCLADAGSPGNMRKGQPRTVMALARMMTPTIYDPLFEEQKADGKRFRREEIISAIVDYIDDDRRAFDVQRMGPGGGGEPDEYTQLYDPYQARHARLDSLDELHLVEGVDDDWMQAFSPFLTIYGDCKVNLNFANAEMIASIIMAAAKNPSEVAGDNYLLKVRPLANMIVQNRAFSLFKDMKDFVRAVENPQSANAFGGMGGMDGMGGMGMGGMGMGGAGSNPAQQLEGVQLNSNGGKKGRGRNRGRRRPQAGGPGRDDPRVVNVEDIASVEPERTYRLEITVSVGSVRRKLTGVYDMNYVRNRIAGKGAWLHVKEQ